MLSPLPQREPTSARVWNKAGGGAGMLSGEFCASLGSDVLSLLFQTGEAKIAQATSGKTVNPFCCHCYYIL